MLVLLFNISKALPSPMFVKSQSDITYLAIFNLF